MTQMHQYLDRRPWEEKVWKPMSVKKHKVPGKSEGSMCLESKERMSQEARRQMWLLRREYVSSSLEIPKFRPAVVCRADLLPESQMSKIWARKCRY